MAKFSDLHNRVQKMMKETVSTPKTKTGNEKEHERKDSQNKDKRSRTTGSNSGNKKPSGRYTFRGLQ